MLKIKSEEYYLWKSLSSQLQRNVQSYKSEMAERSNTYENSESPIQKYQIEQWMLNTEKYLKSMEQLLTKITKLGKQDNPYSLDKLYKQYHTKKVIYKTYTKKLNFDSQDGNSGQEQVTITLKNKQRAEKKLFNFPKQTKTIEDIESQANKNSRIFTKKNSANTLQKYNFSIRNQYKIQQIQISPDEEEKQNQHERFLQVMQKIGKQQFSSMQALRQQQFEQKVVQNMKFKDQKQHQQQISQTNINNSKKAHSRPQKPIEIKEIQSLETGQYRKYVLNHFTSIHNPQDYFAYQNYPIGFRNQLVMNNPFEIYSWVNYYINAKEEYEDLYAVSLDETLNDDDDDTILPQSENSSSFQEDQFFIDNRDVVTYEEFDDDQVTPQDRMIFAQAILQNKKRWIADCKVHQGQDILANFSIISVYGEDFPYSLQGGDSKKTRKQNNSRQKEYGDSLTNINQNRKYQISQIQEHPDQENQTTNNVESRQQIKIIYNLSEQISKEKNIFERSSQIDKKRISHQQRQRQNDFRQEETRIQQPLNKIVISNKERVNNQNIYRNQSNQKTDSLQNQQKKRIQSTTIKNNKNRSIRKEQTNTKAQLNQKIGTDQDQQEKNINKTRQGLNEKPSRSRKRSSFIHQTKHQINSQAQQSIKQKNQITNIQI